MPISSEKLLLWRHLPKVQEAAIDADHTDWVRENVDRIHMGKDKCYVGMSASQQIPTEDLRNWSKLRDELNFFDIVSLVVMVGKSIL